MISQALKGKIPLEVHGSQSDQYLVLATLRRPKKFFQYRFLALIPEDREVAAKLTKLKRHDRIKIVGKMANFDQDPAHVNVKSLEIVKKFDSQNSSKTRDYQYLKNLGTLKEKNKADFLIHYISSDHRSLVLEYGNQIVLMKEKTGKVFAGRSRNDYVTIPFRVRKWPPTPLHLDFGNAETGSSVGKIKVHECISKIHKRKLEITGELVRFPKSPQLKFDVFAVAEKLENGSQRQYTLVNFENLELFEEIRKKAKKLWDSSSGKTIRQRNHFVKSGLYVKVVGKGNWVSKNQANPQILLDSTEGLQSVQALTKPGDKSHLECRD